MNIDTSLRFQDDTEFEGRLLVLLDRAIELTKADFGNIQVKDSGERHLRIVVQRGFQRPFLEFFRIVADDRFSCGTALSSCQRVVVRDVKSSKLYTNSSRQAMLDAGVLACQSTPIVARSGRVVGVLSTHYRRPLRASLPALRQVDAIAREAAATIERFRPATEVAGA